MKDLFEREAEILEYAKAYGEACSEQDNCSVEEFKKLTKEYGRLLKLLRRVTRVSDMTTVELNADKNKLLDKVNIDELTQIYNRRFFETTTKKIFQECQDSGACLGVFMLDVDFFKQYNDTYGHGQGDECLRRIAKSIHEIISQEEGFVARYGGEEFAVVISDIEEKAMKKIAEDILENVRKLRMEHIKNSDKKIVTISIGGCCIRPNQYKEYKEGVCVADEGLYLSKQNGRDRYTLYKREGKSNDK